jgi:hypothetical protein
MVHTHQFRNYAVPLGLSRLSILLFVSELLFTSVLFPLFLPSFPLSLEMFSVGENHSNNVPFRIKTAR